MQLDNPGACLNALDTIDTQLGNIMNDLETATATFIRQQAKYELVEARIFSSLKKAGDIPPSSLSDAAKRMARSVCEDEYDGLWTSLHDSKAIKDSLDRTVKLLDIQRSNVQSRLKTMIATER